MPTVELIVAGVSVKLEANEISVEQLSKQATDLAMQAKALVDLAPKPDRTGQYM